MEEGEENKKSQQPGWQSEGEKQMGIVARIVLNGGEEGKVQNAHLSEMREMQFFKGL